VALHSVGW